MTSPFLAQRKRSLRALKRLETLTRFPAGAPPRGALVWEAFFGGTSPRYSEQALGAMDDNAYRAMLSEYYAHMYYTYFRENGLSAEAGLDPSALALFDLPPDADEEAVRRRFRELAKQHHPDVGGDAASFIRLRDEYNRLLR